MIGLKAVYIDGPAPLENAWDEAPASPVRVVPNVKTDPEVSPLPFHITLQQPKNFTSILLESDPDERHLIADTVRTLFSAVLPSTGYK